MPRIALRTTSSGMIVVFSHGGLLHHIYFHCSRSIQDMVTLRKHHKTVRFESFAEGLSGACIFPAS